MRRGRRDRSDTPIIALKRSMRQLLAMADISLMLTVLAAARRLRRHLSVRAPGFEPWPRRCAPPRSRCPCRPCEGTPPLAYTRRPRAHILAASATTTHQKGDGDGSGRFPDCSVIPRNPSMEQSGQIVRGSHERMRETTPRRATRVSVPLEHRVAAAHIRHQCHDR